MPKRKRFPPRNQAMPTQGQVNGSSSHQVGSHESPRNETEIETNTSRQSDTQNASSNQSEGQSISQTQDESQHPPLTNRKKTTKHWTVNVIDEEGVVKESRLKVQDVFVLPAGNKVIIEWSPAHQPVGASAGLLGGFLGSIASNFANFPIGFDSWPKVPNTYKEHIWKNTIKQKLQVNDDRDKEYIINNLGRKWSNNRCELYNTYHDKTLSLDANIDSPPDGISRDQWALFLKYREKPETKRKCEQNRANRAKQDTTHTLGSMSIARMKWDEEKRLGRPISRGEMYKISHKRKNGSFVNDVARQKSELLDAQPGGASSEDAYTNVFGKEHPGRVRGMGFGVCPSKFFRSTTSSGISTASSSSGAPSNADWQAMKLELQESKSKVKVLEEQIAFLYQLAGHQQPGCNNNSAVNPVADVGSPPIEMRRSSSASHNGEGRAGSYST